MEITWYGLSCFRFTERKLPTVIADPYNGKLGLPPLKLKGEIVTVSHDASGHNCVEAVAGLEHCLNGPGEYEIGGVFITGITTLKDAKSNRNVSYVYDFNGLTIAHLGDMQEVPSQTQIEDLEEVDILLIPIGAGNSLNAAQASELVSMIEPKIVIPMHYNIPNLKLELEGVERFLNEMGVTEPKEESSLKISSSNLPEQTETVILTPRI